MLYFFFHLVLCILYFLWDFLLDPCVLKNYVLNSQVFRHFSVIFHFQLIPFWSGNIFRVISIVKPCIWFILVDVPWALETFTTCKSIKILYELSSWPKYLEKCITAKPDWHRKVMSHITQQSFLKSLWTLSFFPKLSLICCWLSFSLPSRLPLPFQSPQCLPPLSSQITWHSHTPSHSVYPREMFFFLKLKIWPSPFIILLRVCDLSSLEFIGHEK